MRNIDQEFKKTNINFDRSLNTSNILPYNLINCQIQPNELSYHKTFNIKISNLYENLMYIYSRCFIANFIVPTKLIKNESTFNLEGDIKNFVVYNKNDINYLFFNCLTAIHIYEHILNKDDFKFKSLITYVDPISGEISFKNIEKLSVDEDFLYVSDGNLNIVLKYDLGKYLSNENIYRNKLFLIKSVGGEGERYDPIKFKNPKNISYLNDKILIEDYENKTLKFFKDNLNFISYNTLITIYNQITSFSSLKFRTENNIIGTVEQGYYDFVIQNNQIKSTRFISLSSVLEKNEKIKDINFSNYNKNIIYILTDKNFYKKWDFENLNIIGKKSAFDLGVGTEFESFYTIQNNLSSDLIYIYAPISKNKRVLVYEDNLDDISILNDTSFLIYSKDEVFVKKEEYNQSWIYEKSIRKLAKNYDILKNNVSYKFLTEYDSNGILKYLGRIYNTDILNYPQIDYNTDYAVGVNENFQASVINREFEKIYNLSEFLLENVLSNANATLNLNPQPL